MTKCVAETNVKFGDTHALTWVVNMDLTGATVRIPYVPEDGSAGGVLNGTVSNAAEGEVTHVLTGDLPVGAYLLEIEITRAAEVATAPTVGYLRLVVHPDLG